MTQIAFVAYPGVTALDVVGPYEVLRNLPHAQVRFVWLRGRRATSHWLTLPALKAFGAIPVADERIVHQDNIVTSAGVSAGLDLALWLAGQLGGEARAKAIQLAIEYDRSRRSTPVTCRRRRRPPKPPRPRCCPRTAPNRPI